MGQLALDSKPEYYLDGISLRQYAREAAVTFEVNVTEEFVAWWRELTVEQQEHVAARVGLLEQHGPMLGRPTVDRVKGSAFHNMKELRCSADGALRVLFAFDPRRQAILLVGGDKTGEWSSWYDRAVPQADRLYKEYLDEIEEKGTGT